MVITIYEVILYFFDLYLVPTNCLLAYMFTFDKYLENLFCFS